MLSSAFKKRFFFLLNLITGFSLIAILIVEKYPQRIYNRLSGPAQKKYSFAQNANYTAQLNLFSQYKGQKNIVMLGNSHTYRANWNELLERPDVANRGISEDVTEGYLNRMNFVTNVKPKICFIEGGVNDLLYHVEQNAAMKNLNAIIDTLQNNHVLPVLTTVTRVNNIYPDAEKFNSRIEELNKKIISLAKHKNVLLVDLNPALTSGGFLRPEYMVADGVHLNGKAYLIWSAEVNKILKELKI